MQTDERLLHDRPEFAWLIQPTADAPKQWFTISEVSRGIALSPNKLRAFCEDGTIPGAIYYGADVGWKLPRSGLITYFARLLQQRGPSGSIEQVG